MDSEVQRNESSATDLIAQIEERDEQLKSQTFRNPYERDRGGLRQALFAAVLGLTAVVIWEYTHPPFPGPAFDPAGLQSSLDLAVFLTVEGIEAYKADADSLPANLEAVGLDDPELTYTRTETSYEIRGEAGAYHVYYVAGDDLTPFRHAYDALVGQVSRGS